MKTIKLICVFGLMLAVFSVKLFAQETTRSATIKEFKGTVDVKAPKEKWAPAKAGMALKQGDIIRTKANSWALLNLDGNGETATVEVKENSQLYLSQLLTNKEDDTQNTLLDLALGEILIKAQKLHTEASKFEVKTPTSVVAVRGTKFSVTVKALE